MNNYLLKQRHPVLIVASTWWIYGYLLYNSFNVLYVRYFLYSNVEENLYFGAPNYGSRHQWLPSEKLMVNLLMMGQSDNTWTSILSLKVGQDMRGTIDTPLMKYYCIKLKSNLNLNTTRFICKIQEDKEHIKWYHMSIVSQVMIGRDSTGEII